MKSTIRSTGNRPKKAQQRASVEGIRKPVTSGKKALVLDLDETLIHSVFDKPPPGNPYFIIFPNSVPIYVLMRPGLKIFIEKVAEMFDLYVFTAGERSYAEQIINNVCPCVPNSHRFYRNACQIRENKIFKNLRAINRLMKDVILLDDCPDASYFFPKNVIPICEWTGSMNDKALNFIALPILKGCMNAADTRTYLTSIDMKNRSYMFI